MCFTWWRPRLQEVNALTYEANAVTNRAEVEKQEVVKELSRLSELVLSFQQRIQQVGAWWAIGQGMAVARRLCLILLGWPTHVRPQRTPFAPGGIFSKGGGVTHVGRCTIQTSAVHGDTRTGAPVQCASCTPYPTARIGS